MKTAVVLLAVVALSGAAGFSAEPAGMAKRLIEHFHMRPIPDEGGWFAVTYGSSDQIAGSALPARYGGKPHSAGSCIYFVETVEGFSAMHRLQTDEVWHFYGGDPIEMLLLYPDGHGETVVIGPDVFAGQHPQFTVPRGVWQGSAPKGSGPEAYSFAGDQLSPAFDPADFEIGYRDELQKAYPECAGQIAKLTRENFASRPVSSAPKTAAPVPDVTPPLTASSSHTDIPGGAFVLSTDGLPTVEVAPGMRLRELVGRTAPARSDLHSVARFTLAEGTSTFTSHNKISEETFLILAGHGQVTLSGNKHKVGPGSVVTMGAGIGHCLSADPSESLEFFAIETPAFSPADMVVEPAAK